MTKYYRLINKNGGYTWIQSCATLISNSLQPSTPPVPNNATDTPSPSGLPNVGSPASQHGASSLNGNSKNANSLNSSSSNLSAPLNNEEQFEQSIICINYVISRTESENVILDTSQLPDNQNKLKQQRSLNKLQLTHSPPSPPLIQPPAKKMVNNNSKRAQSAAAAAAAAAAAVAAANLQSSSNSNLASPNQANDSSTSSNGPSLALCIIKQSPSNSPCQSPLRHSQLLPIHHNSTHSDEDVPCNNENNHNTMNSVELLSSGHQPNAELKRRRYAASSSPVRPWKNSPSPISLSQTTAANRHSSSSTETSMANALLANTQHLLLGANNPNNSQLHAVLPTGQTQLNPLLNSTASLTCSSPESVCSSSSLNGSSMANNSNLLRHISVIREAPQAILKPTQLVPSAYHQHQNYSSLHPQHSQLHSAHYTNKIDSPHSNHLIGNIQQQQLSHELNSQLANGHSSSLIGHHNTSPVDHLGHLAGITAASSNGMAQHLIQQSTNAPSSSSLLSTSASQSPFHQPSANNLISSHHNHHHSSSLLNGGSQTQALNAAGLNAANSSSSAAEQHATLMHQALTANHHLAHANYTNHLTNQLTHGHHPGLVDPSLVDPYLPYNAAAAAAALHNWYN